MFSFFLEECKVEDFPKMENKMPTSRKQLRPHDSSSFLISFQQFNFFSLRKSHNLVPKTPSDAVYPAFLQAFLHLTSVMKAPSFIIQFAWFEIHSLEFKTFFLSVHIKAFLSITWTWELSSIKKEIHRNWATFNFIL